MTFNEIMKIFFENVILGMLSFILVIFLAFVAIAVVHLLIDSVKALFNIDDEE